MFTNPSEKTCTTCGETKAAGEFYRSRYSRDGRMSTCSACHRETVRSYRIRLRAKNRAKPPDLDAPRRCPSCDETKTGRDFYRNASTTDGLHWVCKSCRRHPRKRKVDEPAGGFAGYELSRQELRAMYEAQGRACAICADDFGDKQPNIDHEHATGRVRGLLCRRCNAALGLFKDDPARIRRADDYVGRTSVTSGGASTTDDLS